MNDPIIFIHLFTLINIQIQTQIMNFSLGSPKYNPIQHQQTSLLCSPHKPNIKGVTISLEDLQSSQTLINQPLKMSHHTLYAAQLLQNVINTIMIRNMIIGFNHVKSASSSVKKQEKSSLKSVYQRKSYYEIFHPKRNMQVEESLLLKYPFQETSRIRFTQQVTPSRKTKSSFIQSLKQTTQQSPLNTKFYNQKQFNQGRHQTTMKQFNYEDYYMMAKRRAESQIKRKNTLKQIRKSFVCRTEPISPECSIFYSKEKKENKIGSESNQYLMCRINRLEKLVKNIRNQKNRTKNKPTKVTSLSKLGTLQANRIAIKNSDIKTNKRQSRKGCLKNRNQEPTIISANTKGTKRVKKMLDMIIELRELKKDIREISLQRKKKTHSLSNQIIKSPDNTQKQIKKVVFRPQHQVSINLQPSNKISEKSSANNLFELQQTKRKHKKLTSINCEIEQSSSNNPIQVETYTFIQIEEKGQQTNRKAKNSCGFQQESSLNLGSDNLFKSDTISKQNRYQSGIKSWEKTEKEDSEAVSYNYSQSNTYSAIGNFSQKMSVLGSEIVIPVLGTHRSDKQANNICLV